MGTCAWSGAGHPITNLVYVEANGIGRATFDTLVADDSRGINSAGISFRDPKSVEFPTRNHIVIFSPLHGDFSGANFVQSGDSGLGPAVIVINVFNNVSVGSSNTIAGATGAAPRLISVSETVIVSSAVVSVSIVGAGMAFRGGTIRLASVTNSAVTIVSDAPAS